MRRSSRFTLSRFPSMSPVRPPRSASRAGTSAPVVPDIARRAGGKRGGDCEDDVRGEDDDVVASDFRTERDEPVEKSARNLEQQRTTRDDGTTACAALGPNDPFRLGGTLTPRRGPQRLPAAHARARDRSSHLDRVTHSLAHPRAHASRLTPAPFARRRARLRAARSRIRRRRIRADASSNNRAHVSR